MPMVEIIEKLSQLEGMFGEISGLGCRDTLVDHIRGLGSGEPEFPTLRAGLLAEVLREILRGDRIPIERLGIEAAFSKNIGRAHHRVLCIWPGLALEAQRFLEVERNHRR